MPGRIEWDKTGEKLFETGTDRGVIYPYDAATKGYGKATPWS